MHTLIEYGKLPNRVKQSNTDNLEKILVSSAIMSASVVSLLSGFPVDSVMFMSLMPIIWLDEDYEEPREFYEYERPNTIDEIRYTPTPISDVESEEQITPSETYDLSDSEEIIDAEDIEKNIIMKIRIMKLAKLLGKLPRPPKMDDYNTNFNYDEMIYYFSTKLPKTSYLRAVKAVQKIDPRIHLKIINKDSDSLTEPNPEKIIIPIRVRDSAWFGWPTVNTEIIGLDDIAHFHCMD